MLTDFRLKVFKTVADRLSFTKAAAELLISQPAVTKQINELERLLGKPLFLRHGNRISLTDDGVRLLEYANRILALYGELRDAFVEEQGAFSGEIRLGASTTLSQYVLPGLLAKFRKLYPEARFRALGKDDLPLIERFWQDYTAVFEKTSKSAKNELALAKTMLRLTGASWLFVGGMEYEGRLISLAMAERCGETLHVHIEKALYGYEGVYPATVQEFARCFAVDGVRYLNREDDAGDRGLRTSKLQYLPCMLAEKFCFDVKNELEDLREIPEIKTERLTLSVFTDEDRAAYNALCLDDERNKWWGYDYRTDWNGEDLKTYFLDVVREDFAKKRAVNFAIRLDGKCIGEVLLYRFDGKGGAEEGCRIAPEYGGQGYGAEAFRAVAEWGLYDRHLSHIVAKCYKENTASYQMLSSCMRKRGEDEKFFYFNKEV